MHQWGQRLCKGLLWSTRGETAQKFLVATKFGRKTNDRKVKFYWYKVHAGVSKVQPESEIVRNVLWLPH